MKRGVKQPCMNSESEIGSGEATIVIKTETPEVVPIVVPEVLPQIVPEQLQLLGELKAKVETLEASNLTLISKVEMLEMEDRWTEDRISNLYRELSSVSQAQPEAEAEEEIQTELDQIPVIPAQAEIVEPQAQPEKERSFWSLKSWL